MDKVMIGGLWVPAVEAKRFRSYGEFDGYLRIDTHKVAKAVGYCKTHRRALDIGAHIGAVSRYLATRFDKVEAFEAIEPTYGLLCDNVGPLANVTAHHAAVSDEAGETYFEHVETHGQLSHMLRPGEEKHFPDRADAPRVDGHIKGGCSTRVGPIRTIAIDDLGYDDVSFIKIDVEGAELEVVKGLAKTIERCRPIIMMEQAGNEAKFHGRKLNEATIFLRSLGMRPDPKYPHLNDKVFRYKG